MSTDQGHYLDLDVDCGEALPDCTFRATGLRFDGFSNDEMLADYSAHRDGKAVHKMVSLTYTLTPGLPSGALPEGRDVNAEIILTPPADPSDWEPVMSVGGERDFYPGPDGTPGAFGPFVLPEGTSRITIRLTNDGITVNGVPPADDTPSRLLGHLHIDLSNETALWQPAV